MRPLLTFVGTDFIPSSFLSQKKRQNDLRQSYTHHPTLFPRGFRFVQETVLGQRKRHGQKKRKRDKISNQLLGQNKKMHSGRKKHKRDKKNDIWDKIKNDKWDKKATLGQNKKMANGTKKTWVKMDNYVRKEGTREGGEKAGVRGGAQI